jgi:hypothetical protein
MIENSQDLTPAHPTYLEIRREVIERFETLCVDTDSKKSFLSPSGRYLLHTSVWSGTDGRWSYSRGVVTDSKTQATIADIKRNHAMFWHSWVMQGESEYLLCGEDYQGYTVIELNAGRSVSTFPEEAFEGQGFCWVNVKPSPDGKTLAVDGCYWACERELVLIDFSMPSKSPLPEKRRFEHLKFLGNWSNNDEIEFTLYPDEDYE